MKNKLVYNPKIAAYEVLSPEEYVQRFRAKVLPHRAPSSETACNAPSIKNEKSK